MMGRSKSTDKVRRAMAMVHPNAAAIDVGATMHVAAVRADRTPEPVRSFGTFTKDLHRLVRLVCRVRGRHGRHGVDQRLLDPDL